MQMERFLTEFLLESFGFTPKKHDEHMKDRISPKIFQEGYMYLYVLLGFISSRKNMIYRHIAEVWALQTVLPDMFGRNADKTSGTNPPSVFFIRMNTSRAHAYGNKRQIYQGSEGVFPPKI